VLALLVCSAQEIRAEIDRLLGGTVQSFLQLNLLHALANAPERRLTVGQLRSVLVDERPNVSRALNKLVELGLVEKTRSETDQRTVYVSITEAGERAHVEGDARLAALRIDLDEPDLKQLFELLVKL